MVAVVQGGIEQGAQQRWSTCIEMCLYQDNTVPVQPCIEPTRGPNKIQTRGFTRGGSYGGGGGGGCGEGVLKWMIIQRLLTVNALQYYASIHTVLM